MFIPVVAFVGLVFANFADAAVIKGGIVIRKYFIILPFFFKD